MSKPKIISPSVRLQALALFTMANRNYLRAAAFGAELANLLGYEDEWADGFGEAWLDKSPNFDQVLANEGFTVRNPKTKKRNQ